MKYFKLTQKRKIALNRIMTRIYWKLDHLNGFHKKIIEEMCENEIEKEELEFQRIEKIKKIEHVNDVFNTIFLKNDLDGWASNKIHKQYGWKNENDISLEDFNLAYNTVMEIIEFCEEANKRINLILKDERKVLLDLKKYYDK